MPFINQLCELWNDQSELFGGFSVPIQAYDGKIDGFGIVEPQLPDRISSERISEDYDGEIIGKIKFDPKTGRQKFIPITKNDLS